LNHGINIYADAAQVRAYPAYFKSWQARALIDRLFPQVVFYQSDYTRQMEAVLRGEVDVAFMLSGWMEANYPQNIPLFQLLGPKQVSYQSETYPFLTSTEIVPSYGVSAAPYIPWVLQQQVYNA
jgi:ABC-type phosphate/phosphonate transport system substrate-binding protein